MATPQPHNGGDIGNERFHRILVSILEDTCVEHDPQELEAFLAIETKREAFRVATLIKCHEAQSVHEARDIVAFIDEVKQDIAAL